MFGRLVEYRGEHGNCNVPSTFDDKQLSAWVDSQRQAYRKGKLDKWYVDQLNQIGFDWDPRETLWKQMFGRLVEYRKEYGNCDVPRTFDDKQLATWVDSQRQAYKNGSLKPEFVEKLGNIEFTWVLRERNYKGFRLPDNG